MPMSMNHNSTQDKSAAPSDHWEDPELRMFQRQLHRFAGEGDCAYERALSTLYKKLFEQRLAQLSAMRNSGL